MNYYQLEEDMSLDNRWLLGDINIANNWLLSRPGEIGSDAYTDLEVKLRSPGKALDFTMTILFKVPVISAPMVESLHDFKDDIQTIPITVPGTPGVFYVLIIKEAIDCLDEERSTFQKFEEEDERAGEYEAVYELKVKADKINRDIFRLAKYDHVVIVSEKWKKKMSSKKLKGLKFLPVS
jgi:hypothetical protein